MRSRIAVTIVGALFAFGLQTAGAQRPDPKQDRRAQEKQNQAQQQELQALIKIVDVVATGQTPASEAVTDWRVDFLKATEGKTYVPFIMTVEPGQIPPGPTKLYLRVTKRGEGVLPPPPAEKKGQEKKEQTPAPSYAFEDLIDLNLKAPPTGQKQRISRSFAVPAGQYDVYVAMKPQGAGQPSGTQASGNAPQSGNPSSPGIIAAKHSIDVPDFHDGQLSTSSVILADKVESLTAAVSKEQQAEQPYTFGSAQITPALDGKFLKNEELAVFFLVYNVGMDAKNKPDVSVEYNFHQKSGSAEKFFNRTAPQVFNAASLPEGFDMALGHQLSPGQSIPLATFPEGEYRLEIKIADRVTGKSLVKDVNFTVTGAQPATPGADDLDRL